MLDSSSLSKYNEVWLLDTEFQTSALGLRVPVCLCAEELRSGRRIELFFDGKQENPFSDGDNVLFVGYNASAEWGTFLVLGWELPTSDIVDLMIEYINSVNGVWRNNMPLRKTCGLIDALTEHGLDALTFEEKEGERDYIIANGITPPEGVTIKEHQRRILDYCWTDVHGTRQLLKAMLKNIDIEQAAHRGRFSVPVAHFEFNGLPVDRETYLLIAERRQDIQLAIAEQVEAAHGYGVYVIEGDTCKKAVFKQAKFDALIDRLGIKQWPVTSTGHYSTEDKKAFEPMARLHTDLEPLRQARKSIDSLSRFNVTIHADGRNRFSVFPFGGVTGRNQPKASECILLRPKWLRSLIQPGPGMALIQIDIIAAEAALAAGFSGDPEGLRVYESGADQYLEFAKATGAAPPDATMTTHETSRNIYKIALLAINYGVGAATLALQLGVPRWKAERILADHKRIYATYWAWAEAQVKHARRNGYISTSFGWTMSVDKNTPHNTILDFPQQAACADVLRIASLMAVERGLGGFLCAPLHDALYLQTPVEVADQVADMVEDCFREAGNIVTDNAVTLRLGRQIIRHPDRYIDKKGAEIWALVQNYLSGAEQLPFAA